MAGGKVVWCVHPRTRVKWGEIFNVRLRLDHRVPLCCAYLRCALQGSFSLFLFCFLLLLFVRRPIRWESNHFVSYFVCDHVSEHQQQKDFTPQTRKGTKIQHPTNIFVQSHLTLRPSSGEVTPIITVGERRWISLALAVVLYIGCLLPSSVVAEPSPLHRGILWSFFQQSWSDPTNPQSSSWVPGCLDGWQTNASSICSWHGVDCGAAGNIDFLALSNCSIVGTIPAALSMIESLIIIALDGNRLTGTLPPELSRLPSLTVISVRGNRLSTELPSEYGALALGVLNLGSNTLFGTIPPQWGNLANLSTLDLSHAVDRSDPNSGQSVPRLNGTIPSSFAALTAMRVFVLNDQLLTGQLPAFIGNWSHLEHFTVMNCAFEGTLPSQWPSLPILREFQAQNNKLSGPLPGEWANTMPLLQILDLSNNLRLNGTIPTCWGHCAAENANKNSRMAGFPAWASTLRQLKLFHADDLEGPLPAGLLQYPNLTNVFLAHTGVNGTLPAYISPSINELYLMNNSIHGPIPPTWGILPTLPDGTALPSTLDHSRMQVIMLDKNELDGTLPHEWGRMSLLPVLATFECCNNHVTGTLPSDWFTLSSLIVFSACNNHITGGLDGLGSWASKGKTNIQKIFVASNNLTGSIPATWAQFKDLAFVEVLTNSLTGTLPRELSALSNMDTWFMDFNGISGTLPPEYAHWGKIRFFHAASNALSGTLPPEWGGGKFMENILEISLSSNALTGSLPASWGAMSKAKMINLAFNSLSGTLQDSWSATLTNRPSMVLSFNYFTGALPLSWSSFTIESASTFDHNCLIIPNNTASLDFWWKLREMAGRLTPQNTDDECAPYLPRVPVNTSNNKNVSRSGSTLGLAVRRGSAASVAAMGVEVVLAPSGPSLSVASAAMMQRAMLQLRWSTRAACLADAPVDDGGGSISPPLDATQSPTQLSIGPSTDANTMLRGAIVGNVLLFGAVAALGYIVAGTHLLRIKRSSKASSSRSEVDSVHYGEVTAVLLHLPGSLIPSYMFLLQPTLSCAVSVLVGGGGAVDVIVGGIVGVGLVAILPFAATLLQLTYRWGWVFLNSNEKHRVGGVQYQTRRTNENSPPPVAQRNASGKEGAGNSVTKAVAMWSTALETIFHMNWFARVHGSWKNRGRAPGPYDSDCFMLERFGGLFEGYRGEGGAAAFATVFALLPQTSPTLNAMRIGDRCTRCFICFEMLFAILSGVLSGLAPPSPAVCVPQALLTALSIANIVYFLLVTTVSPYVRRYDTLVATLGNAVGGLWGVLVLSQASDEVVGTVAEVQLWISIISIGVLILDGVAFSKRLWARWVLLTMDPCTLLKLEVQRGVGERNTKSNGNNHSMLTLDFSRGLDNGSSSRPRWSKISRDQQLVKLIEMACAQRAVAQHR